MPRITASDIVGVADDEPEAQSIRISAADIAEPADDEGISTSEGLFEIARAGLGMPSERMKEAVTKGLGERWEGIKALPGALYEDPKGTVGALLKSIPASIGQSVSDLAHPIETLERDPVALAEAVAGLTGVGGLTAKGLKVPAKLAAKTGERVMQSAIKPVKSVAKTQADTQRMVRAALDEGIDPSEAGLTKLEGITEGLEGQIGPLVAGKSIDPQRPLQSVRHAKGEAEKGIRVAPEGPQNIQKIIDDFKADQPLSAEDAQHLKVTLGKELKPKWGKEALPESTAAGKKALRSGLRESIEEVAPEVGPINKRLGPLYDLERQLGEHTLRREGNLNVLSTRRALGALMAKAGAGAGAGAMTGDPLVTIAGAIAGGLLDNPVNKARVARLLWRAGQGAEKAIGSPRVPIPLAGGAAAAPGVLNAGRELVEFSLPKAADQGPVLEETTSEFPPAWSEEEEQAFQAWLATQ